MNLKASAFVCIIIALAVSAIFADGRENSTGSGILQLLSSHANHLKLKPPELHSLVAGEVIARALPAGNGKEMAGFGLMLAEADPQNFIDAFRTLAVFKQSKSVQAFGRFHSQPSLSDLNGLSIKDKDLLDIMRARVNASEVKLSEIDITRFQKIAGPAPAFTGKLIMKLTAEYKQILLERIRDYTLRGGDALITYADQENTVNANDAFTRMLHHHSSSAGHGAQLYTLLAGFPEARDDRSESFFYWAVQKFGNLKPVINLVHVMIYQNGRQTFIASKQIYSSHYTEAGLGIAELINFTDQNGKSYTLTGYTIRLQVDMLGGSMGFVKRRMAQPRMIETLKESLKGLRQNVEAAYRN
jgi:hypothetical protein